MIRNGAKLVETVEDILEELKHSIDLEKIQSHHQSTNKSESSARKNQIDPQHEIILNCMDFEPISIDEIINKSGLAVEVVSSILLILELNNQVNHHGNGIYIRCNPQVENPVHS